MCINNGEELVLSLPEWCRIFPEGPPDTFIHGDPKINPSLLLGAKARERISRQLETLKNAKGVAKVVSYQKTQP